MFSYTGSFTVFSVCVCIGVRVFNSVCLAEVTDRNASNEEETPVEVWDVRKGCVHLCMCVCVCVQRGREEEVYIFVGTPHPAACYPDWKR